MKQLNSTRTINLLATGLLGVGSFLGLRLWLPSNNLLETLFSHAITLVVVICAYIALIKSGEVMDRKDKEKSLADPRSDAGWEALPFGLSVLFLLLSVTFGVAKTLSGLGVEEGIATFLGGIYLLINGATALLTRFKLQEKSESAK